MLVLGGGGYNQANTARIWTAVTAALLDHPISSDVPESCQHFSHFGPNFSLVIEPSLQPDNNNLQTWRKTIDQFTWLK